jgi:hypothetical protein
MEVDPSLLRTAVAHQRCNDGKVDTSIHQMGCEAVPAMSLGT